MQPDVVGSVCEGSRKDVAIGYGSLSERSLAIADVVKAIAAETVTARRKSRPEFHRAAP